MAYIWKMVSASSPKRPEALLGLSFFESNNSRRDVDVRNIVQAQRRSSLIIQSSLTQHSGKYAARDPICCCIMSFFLVFLASIIVSAPRVHSAALQSLIQSPNLHLPTLREANITYGDARKPLMSTGPLCDADLGEDLNPASCRNALAKIPRKPGPFTFGERDTGNWDVNLPTRYLSGILHWPSRPHFNGCDCPRSLCLHITRLICEAQCWFNG